ncbi:hypothetical protein JB92DRAFT_3114527 [Gautieria morchelliformis]|nr:hypothetical protein JB92DRAFT_3114527 [Gautieria morchelliformis]
MASTTIMTAQEIYDAMKDFPLFVDNDDIIDNVKWEAIGNSDITYDRTAKQEAAFVFPAKITPNRLFVGPLGAYSAWDDDATSSQSTVDNDTTSYPVPSEFKEKFDHIITDYTVNLLPAYNKRKLISPEQTSEKLNGALVEVHLALSHNHIRKQGEIFDSFNGNIRQIAVHNAGSPRPISPYKRKSLHKGPLLPPSRTTSRTAKGKAARHTLDEE